MEKQRFLVVYKAGLFVVLDRATRQISDYYQEWEAKHLAAWLNERSAGYPKVLQ